MRDFTARFLPICVSSTGQEGENKPDYDIPARIARERKEKMRLGMTEEDAKALIPAVIFLSTNTNESSRTFKESFRLVINIVKERKGNIYGIATRSTSRISAKT